MRPNIDIVGQAEPVVDDPQQLHHRGRALMRKGFVQMKNFASLENSLMSVC